MKKWERYWQGWDRTWRIPASTWRGMVKRGEVRITDTRRADVGPSQMPVRVGFRYITGYASGRRFVIVHRRPS